LIDKKGEGTLEKGPDAFRTISEVADDLDLPQHVLRFWETRFGQIKPLKRGGGRRYYRPDDVDLLRGIRHLLYGEGYTIRGVQQILREQGVRHVQSIGQSVEEEAVRSETAVAESGAVRERARSGEGRIGSFMDLLPSLRGSPKVPLELPRVVEVPIPTQSVPMPSNMSEDQLPQFLRKSSVGARPAPRSLNDDPLAQPANDPQSLKLSPDAARLLKTTLNELGECRRMLDAANEREW
jgi:DNA-binding transcriptional MerR regulator